MDIKLKNISYAAGTKAAAIVLAWLCFLCIVWSSLFLMINQDIAKSENYYESYRFGSEFGRLAYDAVLLNVKLKSEENIAQSSDNISGDTSSLNAIRIELGSTVNFVYYVRDTQTGQVFSNVETGDAVAFVNKQAHLTNFNHYRADYYFGYYVDAMNLLAGTSYEAYAAVTEPLKPGDGLYDGFVKYYRDKAISDCAVIILIVSSILFVASAVYLIYTAGRKEKDGEIVLTFVDRIYTDVHTLLVLIAAFLSFAVVVNSGLFHPGDMFGWIVILVMASLDVFIGMSYALSMTRQIKNGQILKNSLVYAAFNGLKAFARLCFDGRLFKPWILLLLLCYGIINGIFFAAGTHIYRAYQGAVIFILFVGFNAAALYFVAKALLSLTRIMEGVKEVSGGNIDYSIAGADMSPVFAGFAEDIQSIQGGLRKAVAEAIKGERMKTDLIANVSHDLKTPLTSIVNYVDLLKKEKLDNDEAEGYITILEEKAARLKQLIEDLIEASKASSGNLAVDLEKVDLHELVMQACGEFEEKIRNAALDVRVSASEKNVSISADGKHMWRIIENLLSNTVKYSMPNSRVYVSITKEKYCGVLTIKNISAFPLDISPDQLTERFVRGDASRTTEGSGLGLSIAQSLTQLQGGSFKIDIDGDLFKVTVEIPLWEEQ